MRAILFRFALLLTLAIPVFATRANGDPRLERLYSTFIAPCCWRENLNVHSSPKADEMRLEIQKLIAAGKSDDEIKDRYLKEYSLRVLALPEGARGQWLDWTPWVLAALGFLAVAWVIRRSRNQLPPQLVTHRAVELPASEWD